MLYRAVAYLRGMIRRNAIEAEADEELQFHLAQAIEANVAGGMSERDARREALRELGGLTQTIEAVRAVRTLRFSACVRDARYGVRALTRTPRFTIVALLTIVLMVGGITTIFSLVDGVLLRPLPYPDADRLVLIESHQPKGFGTKVTLADALAMQESSQSFDRWGLAHVGYGTTLHDPNKGPVDVQDLEITPDLFPLLGLRVAAGRALLPADTAAGASDVAVISSDLAQTLFGSATAGVGRSIQVWQSRATVVGVMASGVDVPENWLTEPIVWRPAHLPDDARDLFVVFAHLLPGVTLERANTELTVVAKRLAAQRPDTHEDWTASGTLLLDHVVGDYKRVLWLFFAAVFCVLLIGLGNLLCLQLARNGSREQEICVRCALGASRSQVIRQLVIESVLLCGIGGAIGLALARPAVRQILASVPPAFPRADAVHVDWRVAAFAIALSVIVGVMTGAIPAWQTSRPNLVSGLNEGGRSATLSAHRARLQRVLIAIETAAALVLVIGAALLLNSFYRVISRDAGMQEDGLYAAGITLPARYRGDTAQQAFWTSALEHLRKLPSVQSASLAVNSPKPLSGRDIIRGSILPEGRTSTTPLDGLWASTRSVSGDYFKTLGIPLLKGRPILDSDGPGTESVAVINQLAATALWPGEDPIGRRVQLRHPTTVVGLIPTYRHARLGADPVAQIYLPEKQDFVASGTAIFMIRAAPGDRAVGATVKDLLMRMEPALPRADVETMAQVRWKQLATERFRTIVLLTFAMSAVFLALVGIFGLVAYAITQHRREIAIRVALGALHRDVMRVVIRQAMVPAFVGIGVGMAGAVVVTRLLTPFLVEIHPYDPASFAAAAALVAAAAVVASLLPARQVIMIDPVEALRSE